MDTEELDQWIVVMSPQVKPAEIPEGARDGGDDPTTENLPASLSERIDAFMQKNIPDDPIATEIWKPFCSVRAWDEGYHDREYVFAVAPSPSPSPHHH